MSSLGECSSAQVLGLASATGDGDERREGEKGRAAEGTRTGPGQPQRYRAFRGHLAYLIPVEARGSTSIADILAAGPDMSNAREESGWRPLNPSDLQREATRAL